MAGNNNPDTLKIKKYPNRRFYDVSRSRHVTLQDLHRLVREGRNILVTDSKSGEDITPQVLAQIILEHDAPKMALFGADLLHQVIQANQQMLRSFMETYFGRALESFVQSQSQFEEWWRKTGMPSMGDLSAANPLNWAKAWMQQGRGTDSSPSAAGPTPQSGDLRETVDNLRRQVAELQDKLSVVNRPPPRRGKKGRKKS